MKQIEIDMDIHKLIEATRESFDETPTEILRRLLGIVRETKTEAQGEAIKGLYCKGVLFPDGLRLRKYYKGVMYNAEVRNGYIVCDEKQYTSPSAIACFITGTSVNGWKFWEYFDKMSRSWISLEKLPNDGSQLTTNHRVRAKGKTQSRNNPLSLSQQASFNDNPQGTYPWVDIIVRALQSLGGKAELCNIYREVQRIHPGELTPQWQATVRNVIESHSSDSKNFNGKDIFYSVEGKGHGIWGLRNSL